MGEQIWTKPFYGVSHLDGLKRGFQVTVTDWGDYAEVGMFIPGSGFRMVEKQMCDSAELARAAGARMAKNYGAFA